MTSVIKHALRASAGMFGSYRPEGWNPRLRVQLHGPVPAGAELVWAVARPDGSPWFEHRARVPELDPAQTTIVDLQRWADDGDLAEPGTVAFTLRIVSTLDGVDELLHDGSLTAVALDGHQRYAIDNDWTLGLALVCLDAVDEYDAPRLTVTAFLKGDVGTYQLEAHCFHDGQRIAAASHLDDRHTFTANDGTPVGHEVVAVFDGVRGWNNLRESGWGGDWHLLDEHDGRYEVKLLRESELARVISFEVSAGRIVAVGAVESDPASGAVVLVDAAVKLTEQDTRVITQVIEAGRALVIAYNKWDLMDEDRRPFLEREIEQDLVQVQWAPRVNISAKTGWHTDRMVPALERALASWDTRISTGRLNAFLGELVAAHPHPLRGGKQPRILFATQASTRPPRFVIFATGFLDPGYRRYIERRLRETFGFEGTPISISVRVREKRKR